jgi:TP901 family phage tail tape measure protein
MAKQTTEAIITLNGKQPIEVLNQMHSAAEKIKAEMEQVQQKMKGMSPKDDAYKQLNGTLKELKGQYDLLSSAQVKDIEATQRLQSAVENLASTSLKNLRKALGDGKRQLEGLSEAELEQANTLRSLMKTVGDQVRLLEGKFVKIREGLASIGTQSDQWLNKAIAQQQELMATTRRGTKEYKEQEQVMQMLTAEQNKRNAAIAAEAIARRQAQFKQQVASSRQMLSSGDLSKYSSSEVQTSINTLKQAQSQAAMGGSEWQRLAAEIKKAEDELDRLLGKTKEVKQQMSEGDARSILGNIGGHTEQEVREAINALRLLQSTVNVGGSQWNAYAADIEKAETELGKMTGRIKEAKQGLSMNDVENRMQNLNAQSEQSLKEMLDYLQKAKAELTPYTQQWKDVATQIDTVKQRMGDVQANTPYLRNEQSAQYIAHNDRINFESGKTYDITRKDLQWSKEFLQKQLDVTPVADTAKIQQIQEALGLIEQRMNAIDGAAKKSAMSTEKLNEVLGNIKTASLEELRDASAELKRQLNGLAPSSNAAKQIKKHMQDLDREIKQVEDDMVDVNDVIARSKNGKASIVELKKAYKQLEDELNHLATGSKEFTDKRKDLEALRDKIEKVTVSVHKQRSAWQTAMKNLTAYVGLFQAFGMIKNLITSVVKKNFEYSASLTDIRKVSGLTEDQVKSLSTELAKIDTRTSVDALAQLAYQGAKLGVGKYGVDGMAQFVRAADKINVAIGEEMGEEALPALLKMTEVMGLIPKMGLERSIEATGSAMFKLASTSTATSNDIVEFAKRCTGVARTAGITTDQLLALGSAFSAQMASPEVAATAMSKFIVALQKNHNLIEKNLSIPAGTISKMYEAGNAMDAIVLILEKMKAKGNMNALGDIFKDVGGDGQRLISSMVTMAKNVDMLKDHLYESQEAFEEATAVGKEYDMQQMSAIGILERANNLWEKAFVNPDGVDMVKNMAIAWYDLSEMLMNSPIYKGMLVNSLKLLALAIQGVIYLMPGIINGLVAMGVWKTFMFFVKLKDALIAAKAAQEAFNIAAAKNIYLAAAVALSSLISWIWSAVEAYNAEAEAQEEATRKANAWRDTIVQAQTDASILIRKLDNYKRILEDTNISQENRNRTIGRFNKDFHTYITNLGIEIKNVNDLKKNYSALATEIRKASFYRSREKALQEGLEGNRQQILNAGTELQKALDVLPGGNNVNVADIQSLIDAGYGYGRIYNKIVQMTAPSRKKSIFKGGRLVEVEKSQVEQANEAKFRAAALKKVKGKLVYLYNSTHRYNNKSNEIYDAYERAGLDRNYQPFPDEDLGGLTNTATDKDALKQERLRRQKERQDRLAQEKAWRDELKQKQTEAEAIMDNFNHYYERQINEKIAQAIKLGMNEEERKFFIQPLLVNQNKGARQLRLAIAGKMNSWDNFKLNVMPQDMIEKADETGVNLSKDLLSDVQGVNVDALRSRLDDLGSSLNIPFNSILAEVFEKSTKNEREILDLIVKQKEARRKDALEHDYVGVVKQNMYDSFNTRGYANPNETELLNKTDFDKRKANIIAMFEKAREEITKVYAADVSTKEGRGLLMKTLFGDDPDGMAARIKEVLGEDASEWKTFYLKLLQYSDEYTAAEKKKYDDAKRYTDYLWDTNPRNQKIQNKIKLIESEKKMYGKQSTFKSNLGLSDIKDDPEIALMKARMQAAEDYYLFVKQNTDNQKLRDEAERARQEAELAYVNQVAASMKERLSQMKSFVQPIEDFGAAVGQALATMKNDAKSANEAIKSALKSMLESWSKMALDDVNKQMWQAINNAGVKKAEADAQPAIKSARESSERAAKNGELGFSADLGTPSNPMYVHVVNGQPVDANGNPVAAPLTPTGDVVSNPDGSKGVPPASTKDFGKMTYDPASGQDRSSVVFKDTASQAGSSVADVATGQSSFSEAAAGMAGSVLGTIMNTDFGSKQSRREKREQRKQQREAKKHQRELTKETKKGVKEREKLNKKGSKEITKSTEEESKAQVKTEELKQKTTNAIVDTSLNTNFQLKKENDKNVVEQSKNTASAENTFSIVGAVGKCFEYLGPIAGPIAAAAVMALLTGLMQWGLNAAFGGNKNKNNSSSGPNTKLVSGMLTYDSGNVQDMKPFVGDNGEIYWAREQDKPQGGVNLLITPTATTINGQRALVAENGPELVIGRETTKAMMMNNPSLLKALVNYDANYSGRNAARRAFDEGNLAEALGNLSSGASATDGLIADSRAANIALITAINTLMQRLDQPIHAKIDMYGRGNLYDSMSKANQFMKGKS